MTEPPEWALKRRSGWRWDRSERPGFAEEPGPGDESVWDDPRPPRIEEDEREVTVRRGDLLVARTTDAHRMLETASPPALYPPPGDVRTDLPEPAPGSSRSEWKREARYRSLGTPGGERVRPQPGGFYGGWITSEIVGPVKGEPGT